MAAAFFLAGPAGQEIFQQKCILCHGQDGKAQTDMGKKVEAADLTSSNVQQLSASEMTKIVKSGKGKMPSFDEKLSNDQIKAVVGYVRTLGQKH